MCTATTPSMADAAEVSMALMRACAYGLRSTARNRAPGIGRSAVYLASPVSSGASSRRSMRVPMWGVVGVSVAVMR